MEPSQDQPSQDQIGMPTPGAPAYSVHCPHCQIELLIQAEAAGQTIDCPNCHGSIQTPPAGLHPGGSMATTYAPVGPLNHGIKICVLISAITNIVVGLFWISTLCGAIIGIPQIVLAAFEIAFFTQADNQPLNDALERAKHLGIIEIVLGLVNPASLVCGILVLVFRANQE